MIKPSHKTSQFHYSFRTQMFSRSDMLTSVSIGCAYATTMHDLPQSILKQNMCGSKTAFHTLTQLLRGVLIVVGFKFPHIESWLKSVCVVLLNRWFIGNFCWVRVFQFLVEPSRQQSIHWLIHHWSDRPLLYADGASNLQRSFDFLRCDFDGTVAVCRQINLVFDRNW